MNTHHALYQRLPISIRERGEELAVAYLKNRRDNRRDKISKARMRLEGFLIGAFTGAGLPLSTLDANLLAKAVIDDTHAKYAFSLNLPDWNKGPKKAS